jgi:hypothetical protein
MNSLSARDLPWHDTRTLTPEERAAITTSIQQFQLGEGSNGRRLLERGQEYAKAVDDPLFTAALARFVEEEQRHSWYLARFMEVQGIPVLRRHWVDTAFRGLRGLAGLELSLTVLVTAELTAVPYYRALRSATNSVILRAISTKILEDEGAHLKFQASMLARLASKRPLALQRLMSVLHRLFLLGTIVIVWVEHQNVFKAARYDFGRLKSETLRGFHDFDSARREGIARSTAEGRRNLLPSP